MHASTTHLIWRAHSACSRESGRSDPLLDARPDGDRPLECPKFSAPSTSDVITSSVSRSAPATTVAAPAPAISPLEVAVSSAAVPSSFLAAGKIGMIKELAGTGGVRAVSRDCTGDRGDLATMGDFGMLGDLGLFGSGGTCCVDGSASPSTGSKDMASSSSSYSARSICWSLLKLPRVELTRTRKIGDATVAASSLSSVAVAAAAVSGAASDGAPAAPNTARLGKSAVASRIGEVISTVKVEAASGGKEGGVGKRTGVLGVPPLEAPGVSSKYNG